MRLMNERLQLTFPSERELVMVRRFRAPRALLFAAMTKPEHVRQWYGPAGHSMPVCEIDLRVNGRWRFVTHAPDGTEFAFSGVYREIDPPQRIVFTEGWEALPGHDYIVTATYAEKDGITTLTSHLLFQSQADRDGLVASGMEAGANESYRRLQSHLLRGAATAQNERALVIERKFDAPQELVFNAWSTSEHLAAWWGPEGFELTTESLDFRANGRWLFTMHGPDGTDYLNEVIYESVEPVARISYRQGEPGSPPEEQFHVSVIFESHGGKTHLTMIMTFPSQAIRDRMVTEVWAVEGGHQTLDRLAARLEETSTPGSQSTS